MKFTKIKYDGTTVNLEYQNDIKSPDGKPIATVESKFKSTEKPLESFNDTLQSLASEAGEMLSDIFKPKAFDGAKVRGVSLSWANDIMGAVITLLVDTESANSPVVINTPHLPSEDYNPTGNAPTLSGSCIGIIESLIDEAERFFNGEREKKEELFPTETDK